MSSNEGKNKKTKSKKSASPKHKTVKKRSVIRGELLLMYKNPLTQRSMTFLKGSDIEVFLNRDDNIMIYMNDEPMPFLMKRSYFANILFDDIVYECPPKTSKQLGKWKSPNTHTHTHKEYYHLFKLFVNYPEYKDIIIEKTVMDKIVKNRVINKYHIFTKSRQINTIAKSSVDLRLDTSHINSNENKEILKSLQYYTGQGYRIANGYLIRTSDYPQRRRISEHAKEIADLKAIQFSSLFSCLFDSTWSKHTQCGHIRNQAVDKMVHYMDLAFIKIAPRVGRKGMTLRRNVNSYYPYLSNIGDKMIIENYISTSKYPKSLFGNIDSQFGNIEYIVQVSPGIPYITNSDVFEGVFYHLSEREVILPRNLLAELVEIETDYFDEDGDEFVYPYPRHTIRLSLTYNTQFEMNDIACKKRTLYSMEPYIQRSNYSTKSAEDIRRSNKSPVHMNNSN